MSEFASANLRRLMTQAGLTINAVVEKTGLNHRTVKGVLDGSNRPHTATLHRLAQGLGVSSDEFFVDPAQLLYRRFDRQTNPLVAEAVGSRGNLFHGWTEADFDELHSRVGTGGALTLAGTIAAVEQMNRNRAVHEKLALLLESSQGELIRGIVEMMYAQVLNGKG